MPRVLVIEDDRTLCKMLSRVLTREGYAVTVADNGQVGLARLEEEPADLVITDIFMPVQEGLETIRTLRRNHPDVAIIAISGGGNSPFYDCLGYAEKFGAAYTLAKPFTPAELVEVVQRALQRDGQAPCPS